MQWKTLIVNPDNWVLGENANKDIMIWAIQDRPWYNIRTYGIDTEFKIPSQLKTNSWTNVEINTTAVAPDSVRIEALLIQHRINFFTELSYRLRISAENLGISDANLNVIHLHEYLVSIGIIKGECASDAAIQYENKIRLLQDLNTIKTTVVDAVLNAKNAEEFKKAHNLMERLFFTNILL